MPALKCDVQITIKAGGRKFSIGGVRVIGNRYLVKRGRSWSKKIPMATLSQIFSEARKWAVKNV